MSDSENLQLHALQQQAQATFLSFGPADADAVPQVVETFGMYEAEYAAIRKGVGLLHTPQRGLVEVRGSDRLDFLHRLFTNDTRTLRVGEARRAFALARNGRIVADLVILHQEQRTLLVTDVFQAQALPTLLEQYQFSEDVQAADLSAERDQISLHGPAAATLLEALGGQLASPLESLTHQQVELAGRKAVVYRRDETGALGLHVIAAATDVVMIYAAAAEALGGLTPPVEGGVRRAVTGRGIGWLAYNTARIEAGTPLFNIDFGTDSLPHETGVLDQAVSFTKGCYIGQEIVARMQNLGHPKRVLVGVKFENDRLPIAGSQVFSSPKADTATESAGTSAGGSGEVVGAITSSTLSPLLGQIATAFAVVKWGQHNPGTTVAVPAEGANVRGVVGPLRFIP